MKLRAFAFLLAALAVVLLANPVAANTVGGTAANPASAETAPLLGSYKDGFIEYWSGVFKKQNGIVMGTLLVGALCLFIITRGKWRK
jgi:hypothetical protein